MIKKSNNKPEKPILRILYNLKYATYWFKNNNPTFVFPEMVCEKGVLQYKSYNCANNRTYYDYLTLYLFKYNVKYTNDNYPFLVYNDFIWKEDIFYSRHIPIDYVIKEDVSSMGPKSCKRCKKNYKHKYKLFLKFCSKCTEKLM